MKKFFCTAFILTFLIAGFGASFAFAQTIQTPPDLSSLIADLESQIKALQTRIAELETELGVKPPPLRPSTDARGSAGQAAPLSLPTFTTALSLGSRGDDVRNLQQFLAQFSDLYPEGLITGYFGPLTERAVQRWQAKEGIVTQGTSETTGYGRIGPKTRTRLNELITEGAGKSGVIPPGLLRAPGLQDKISTTTPSSDVTGTATTTSLTATTTPPVIPPSSSAATTATTTPSGTIPATPAVPATQTAQPATTATPAVPATTTTTATSSTTTTTATTAPPIFTITSPNGGEQMTVGNTYTITWTSTGISVSTVNVELYKSGSYNAMIAYNVSNNGSTSWTVPATMVAGTDYKIRVYNNTSAYYNNFDESDSTFTIIFSTTTTTTTTTSTNTATPTKSAVTMSTPNGGEQWQRGSTHEVRWTHSLQDSNFSWQLIVQGSVSPSPFYYISEKLPITQSSFLWTVPTSLTALPNYLAYKMAVQLWKTCITSPCLDQSDVLPSNNKAYLFDTIPFGWGDDSDGVFTIASSSSVFKNKNNTSLALLLQSLSVTLDDIQKQIQKLAR